jgi:DNA recombination protein RmuC
MSPTIEILFGASVLVLLLAVLWRLYVLPRRMQTAEAAVRLEALLSSLKEGMERLERTLRDELGRLREEASSSSRLGREELSGTLKGFGDSLGNQLAQMGTVQNSQLDSFARQLSLLTATNETKLEQVRTIVEERLRTLQEDNSAKLEMMRSTVDEKLHATLEQRLGESFRLVSERLEAVQSGLGEMRSLATGVGDLKKVLSNIKTRGTFGEMQLGALLEQVLTPEQYSRNVSTRLGSGERVEYAIRLPGKDDQQKSPLWLPIDAKFPQEDYQRLVDAQEQANAAGLEEAGKMLEVRIKSEARAIKEKYLDPPHTTDFAIMFLPTEGLFAEVLRRPGLFEAIQRDHRVTITGPTTLLALLNSLQMGFRTLAIEKRSSEVWSLLGAVKTEFGRFGEVLDKTQKKLQEASNTIEDAATRSRQIERKLKNVQELPAGQTTELLGDGKTESE